MEDSKLNPKTVTVTLSHTHSDVTYAARFSPDGLLSLGQRNYYTLNGFTVKII